MSYLGETERFEATITSYSGTPQDPTSQVVTLHDPAGTLVSTDNAPVGAAGVYYVDFLIPAAGAAGIWTVLWKTTLTVGPDSWYGVGVLAVKVDEPV